MPFSPSLAKILPEEPGWKAIFRPTAATTAIPSVTCRLSGLISFSMSPSAWYRYGAALPVSTTSDTESIPEGMYSTLM